MIPTSTPSLSRIFSVLIAVLMVGAPAVQAQNFAPKPMEAPEPEGPCPAFEEPDEPSDDARQESSRLASAGQQAAILGDPEEALGYLQRAATLNPADANLAYRLARLHDDLGRDENALREHCRFVSMAPDAPEAGEAQRRINDLAPPPERTVPLGAERQAAAGVEHLESGEFSEARTAFSNALGEAPDWAELQYNLGLVADHTGDSEEAARRYERYLELAEDPNDRSVVRARVQALRAPVIEPSGALVRGVFVPGLGQFHTQRPLIGTVVLAAVGTAAFVAVQADEVTETASFTDPFGNVREYERTVIERPNLEPGIAAAVALTLAGAIEAYLYASRNQRRGAPLAAIDRADRAAGSRPDTGTGVRFSGATVRPATDGLRVGLELRF